MKNTPSAGDHGSSLPELEVDEVVAQRAAPHMPQPALEVEHESRSVVICDPESDEDGPTPTRGIRSPFAGGASSAEPPSAPLAAAPPSARPRQLEEYARRREKTVVIDRKRSVPPAVRRRSARHRGGGLRQHWHLVVAVVGICALAFAVGRLVSHLGTRKLVGVPPAMSSSSLPLSSALQEPALVAPVKLSDLPIEPATDASARSASSARRARARGEPTR